MSEHLRTLVEIVNFFFLFFVVFYTSFLFLSVIYGAVESEKRVRQTRFHKGITIDHAINYVPISILVPAYNEELTILDTVKSLCILDYPEFEIIVIDDGSLDQTAEILIHALQLKKRSVPSAGRFIVRMRQRYMRRYIPGFPLRWFARKTAEKGMR